MIFKGPDLCITCLKTGYVVEIASSEQEAFRTIESLSGALYRLTKRAEEIEKHRDQSDE